MKKKEYSAPQSQVIELNMNAALLTMSTTDTLELDVNDPTETISGEDALAPFFGNFGLPPGFDL